MLPSNALLSLAALAVTTSALNPLEVHEQEFLDSQTGERFVIVGVDYQPGGQSAYGTGQGDPLSNGTLCLRDAALMQRLGVNSIRSYNVNPALNHDECASIFNEAGIYMLIDVNSPLAGQSIDRSAPWTTYDVDYLTHIFSVVEAFKSYPNTLGFFAGNEIINDQTTGLYNPPYIRAVQRDLKNYIAAHSSRTIPVGYSAAQVETFLASTWEYLQCNNSQSGTDEGRSDFFGLNSYSWCGDSSYTQSGYNGLVSLFNSSSIPVFFSEYGCNKPAPRLFDEVLALYGPQMTALSGGLVYEFTEGPDLFGLVNDNSNGSVTLLRDFDTLQTQLAKINVTLGQTANRTAAALSAPVCEAALINVPGFSTNFTLPAVPPGAAAVIASGVSNPPSGSLVSVTNTVVNLPVYATNGALITGLVLTSRDSANVPQTASTSTSAASTAATSTHKSAAVAARHAAGPISAVFGGTMVVAALFFGAGMVLL